MSISMSILAPRPPPPLYFFILYIETKLRKRSIFDPPPDPDSHFWKKAIAFLILCVFMFFLFFRLLVLWLFSLLFFILPNLPVLSNFGPFFDLKNRGYFLESRLLSLLS